MASVERMISERLWLTVNPLKSAVDRPAGRTFLGFTVSCRDARLKVADKAIDRLKVKVRALTRRTRGRRHELGAAGHCGAAGIYSSNRREDIEDHWFAYRDEAIKALAVEFLETEGIPFEPLPDR
jgi:hypothetical protein